MAESEIQRAIQRWLKGEGAYVVKTAPPMENGTPDLLVCMRGVFMGIECKQPGQSPSKIQQHRMAKIREAGGIAFMATSVADVKRELENLTRRLNKARLARESADASE